MFNFVSNIHKFEPDEFPKQMSQCLKLCGLRPNLQKYTGPNIGVSIVNVSAVVCLAYTYQNRNYPSVLVL